MHSLIWKKKKKITEHTKKKKNSLHQIIKPRSTQLDLASHKTIKHRSTQLINHPTSHLKWNQTKKNSKQNPYPQW